MRCTGSHVNQDATTLANKYEGSAFVLIVPEAGGFQVSHVGTPGEALKLPALLRHIADTMEAKGPMQRLVTGKPT